jgi:RNA polymerase sigma-70 factor (ECF subfamily)
MLDQDRLDHLLARSAQRDQRAFAELYELTSSRLFAVCLRILRRRDWAEEVLQETYVKVWHRADSYHAGRGSVLTWLTSVARYAAIDTLRSRRNDPEPLDDATADSLAAPADSNPEFLASGPNLDNCMNELGQDQRQSIMLAFHLGLTHEEVGARLERPLGTVKSWIRRGLESLKRCLQA